MNAERFENEIRSRMESEAWSRAMSGRVFSERRKRNRAKRLVLAAAAAVLFAVGGVLLALGGPLVSGLASLLTGTPSTDEMIASASDWFLLGEPSVDLDLNRD